MGNMTNTYDVYINDCHAQPWWGILADTDERCRGWERYLDSIFPGCDAYVDRFGTVFTVCCEVQGHTFQLEVVKLDDAVKFIRKTLRRSRRRPWRMVAFSCFAIGAMCYIAACLV